MVVFCRNRQKTHCKSFGKFLSDLATIILKQDKNSIQTKFILAEFRFHLPLEGEFVKSIYWHMIEFIVVTSFGGLQQDCPIPVDRDKQQAISFWWKKRSIWMASYFAKTPARRILPSLLNTADGHHLEQSGIPLLLPSFSFWN